MHDLPLLTNIVPILEKWLQRAPRFWKKLEANKPLPEIDEEELAGHVVIIGYGRVGKHLVDVLQMLEVPLLVIEADMEAVKALNERNVATLYGDAANSEVITHAGLERARALVVTVPEESIASMTVIAARAINPKLAVIVRAATEEGLGYLSELGADHIIHPELEGDLEMIHHTLLQLGYPLREVHEYAQAVRKDRYNIQISSSDEHRSLHDLVVATDSIEITWLTIDDGNPLAGQTLFEANIRSRTGASVIGIIRAGRLIANPKSSTRFDVGDRVGLIGEKEQIETTRSWSVA